MKDNKAICPKCGSMQRNLNLKETDGWVVCYECDTKFKYDEAEQNELKNKKEATE